MLQNAGINILDEIADLVVWTGSTRKGAAMRNEYPWMKLEALLEFEVSTFFDESNLITEENCMQ